MRTFGKYRLVEPIASGGMADVWRAEVTGAAGVVKEVALKLVRGEHAGRSDFVRMFVQEARLAARLTHANVVQVFEFDQVDGRYYIAMELVRGRHLGRVAERARELGIRFGTGRTLQVGVDVARALAYAHRLADGGRPVGLVHRDVSPHNVLVSFEGEVKLADFGIARAMDQAGMTAPGTLKGKVAYMAPEQARVGAIDARADVFALGVVLWELCAGRRLFARETEAATLDALLSDEPISPPSAWNEEVPPELDAAVLAALARDPARRTGSAQELATVLSGVLLRVARSPDDVDLRAFMHRLFPAEIAALQAPPPEATRVRPVAMAAEPVAEASEVATRTVVAPRRRSGRAWAIAGAAAVGAAAIAAGGAAMRPPHPDPLPRQAPGARESVSSPSPSPSTSTSTSTSTNPSPNPPAPALSTAAPHEVARKLDALALPPRTSGEGILFVNATPWGNLQVNGHAVGDTPRELRLPAGLHRIRILRKGRPAIDEQVLVKAGARTKLLR